MVQHLNEDALFRYSMVDIHRGRQSRFWAREMSNCINEGQRIFFSDTPESHDNSNVVNYYEFFKFVLYSYAVNKSSVQTIGKLLTLLSILTKLLHKIQSFGIIGTLFKWFEAYLSDRAQYVQVSNRFSELLPVLSGVPQGSIQAHYFLFYL